MRTLITLFILVFGPYMGFSSEPYRVDVRQEAFADHADSLDHLEPVKGTVPEFYYIAQFVESPSFVKGSYFAVLKTKQGRYILQLASIPVDTRPVNRPKVETELEIQESLAEVIYQIWANALLEVRYDRKSYRGNDGTDFTFSTFIRGSGWMHGSTWSPDTDLPPKWLVDSAQKIIAFARDPKRDAKKTETSLAEARDKLFAYIEKHGKH